MDDNQNESSESNEKQSLFKNDLFEANKSILSIIKLGEEINKLSTISKDVSSLLNRKQLVHPRIIALKKQSRMEKLNTQANFMKKYEKDM